MSWWRTTIVGLAAAMAGCSSGDGVDAQPADLEAHLATIDWSEVRGSGEAPPPQIEIGDLVPCAIGLAEFELEIRAMREGECWYQQRRTFRRYAGPSDDAADAVDLSSERLICATLMNGFASGSLEYPRLAKDHVAVRVHWQVKQEQSTEFAADITAALGESGSVDAGEGKSLEWDFQILR